mmetsp:Transcript_76268/g.203987  ORF Transcript_76268/g.203987 Transcript_76268/m.203987 type:complete len:239 (+) Transcript_76268:134-850(+)
MICPDLTPPELYAGLAPSQGPGAVCPARRPGVKLCPGLGGRGTPGESTPRCPQAAPRGALATVPALPGLLCSPSPTLLRGGEPAPPAGGPGLGRPPRQGLLLLGDGGAAAAEHARVPADCGHGAAGALEPPEKTAAGPGASRAHGRSAGAAWGALATRRAPGASRRAPGASGGTARCAHRLAGPAVVRGGGLGPTVGHTDDRVGRCLFCQQGAGLDQVVESARARDGVLMQSGQLFEP